MEMSIGQILRHYRRDAIYSQKELADKIGYHNSVISRIENDRQLPTPEYLHRFGQVMSLADKEFRELMTLFEQVTTKKQRIQAPLHESKSDPGKGYYDWGEMIESPPIYGRDDEIEHLGKAISKERFHLVAILGMGGVGKSALARKVSDDLLTEFDFIVWRSLRSPRTLSEILEEWLLILSQQRISELPKEVDSRIHLLGYYLQQARCLLVLDNIESILREDKTGQYRKGYEDYGNLLQFVSALEHQSCLVLTSREKPKDIHFLEDEASRVRALELDGLKDDEGILLLKKRSLVSTDEDLLAVTRHYSGNPLALFVVSEMVRDVYHGKVNDFLKEGLRVFGDINDLLAEQFERLPKLEQDILIWLAVEREQVTLNRLYDNFIEPISRPQLQEAILSLRRRFLIERGDSGFTLQNVVMEYITSAQVVAKATREIINGNMELLRTHTLLMAQAEQYIREAQRRSIIEPLVRRLFANLRSSEAIVHKLHTILDSVRGLTLVEAGYSAGNALNMLCHLQQDLTDLNLSNLVLWQVYLRDYELHGVDLSNSDLSNSVFMRTFGTVLSVSFSPGGNLLGSGSSDGLIRLWRMSDGQQIGIFTGHEDWVRAVAFSWDGKTIVSGSDDQQVKLWDVASGQCLNTLEGHQRRIRTVAFSPNNKIVASGSDDGTIRIWEVHTGRCLHLLEGHTGLVRCVSFSRSGTIIASASTDKTLRIWDVSSGKCLQILEGHKEAVMAVMFSNNDSLASGSNDTEIIVWDVDSGQPQKKFKGHSGEIWSIAYSGDGKFIASGSSDRTVRVWDIESGECIHTLFGHENWVRSVSFHPSEPLVASGSEDQTIRIWNTFMGRCLNVAKGYNNPVRALDVSPTGEQLVSGSDDRKVRLWDLATNRCVGTMEGHSNRIWTVAFSPDGHVLSSGSSDETIRLWDVKSSQSYKILQGNLPPIWSLTFSPDKLSLASAGDDSTIRIWDVRTGQCYKTLEGHEALVRTIVYHPSKANYLISSSLDTTIRVWNLDDESCENVLRGHTSRVWTVAISQDGSFIASGSNDRTVRLWDFDNRTHVRTLPEHNESVWSLAFSPDGITLAAGCKDGYVYVWDFQSGRLIKRFQGHKAGVGALIFNKSGTLLISGSDDEFIKLWDTKEYSLKAKLRSDRPYERMNIANVTGLSEGEKSILKTLGAVDKGSMSVIDGIDQDFSERMRDRYSRALFAIMDKSKSPIGTGFLVLYGGEIFGVTCGHILYKMELSIGDDITVQHFDPDVGNFPGRVVWLGFSGVSEPENWSAKQDIAVISMGKVPKNTSRLVLHSDLVAPLGRVQCWCFGYVQSKRPRGAWIDGLTCESRVGKGFIQLNQSGKVQIEPGASGAPVCDERGNVVGMLQSVLGSRIAYLIPSETILEVVSSIY